MRIISERALREFWATHSNAETPLLYWRKAINMANCKNPAELKRIFPTADVVGGLTVFNIGGNHFRLIAYIKYSAGIVFVKNVLTHKQYDEGHWKQ